MTDNKVAALAASIDHSISPERRKRQATYQLAALREIGWDLVKVKEPSLTDHPYMRIGVDACCNAPLNQHLGYGSNPWAPRGDQ